MEFLYELLHIACLNAVNIATLLHDFLEYITTHIKRK